MYLNDVKTKYNRTDRNFVGLTKGFIIFKYIRLVLGRFTSRELSSKEWAQAHLYVIKNCEDVIPLIK